MPLNSENCRALTGEVVEQATAAPGEKRDLGIGSILQWCDEFGRPFYWKVVGTEGERWLIEPFRRVGPTG